MLCTESARCASRIGRRAVRKPDLHVVANDDPLNAIRAELRACFAEIEQINRQLAAAEARALAARTAYAKAQGLRALPRLELLKTRYSQQESGQ